MLTTGVLLLGVLGCADGFQGVIAVGAKDAGGLTLAQVEGMSLEEEFELLGEREARLHELMTPAQEQYSTGSWYWLGGGAASDESGGSQFDSLRGATDENSYHLQMTRSATVEGAVGEKKDAEMMASYFESQGWETERSFVKDEELEYQRHTVVAHTDDGYWLEYWVQDTGFNTLTVSSGTFWTENYEKLSDEVWYRIPKGGEFPYGEETVPGMYVPFPKWSDPKLWEWEL